MERSDPRQGMPEERGEARGAGEGAGGDPELGERWIETPRGGLFFINAIFIFPYIMVLVPLATRLFVRGVLGGAPRESVILDTFPVLAGFLLPRYGWLILLPLFLVARNLRMERAAGPRSALLLFLVIHAGFLAWTVAGWMGAHAWTLPGGTP